MEHLIEVAFKGNRREFFRWSFEAPPPVKAAIIVDVERGEDLGRVHATGELAERRKAGTTHGKAQREPLRPALRLATGDDIARAATLRAEEETARRVAVQKARALNLQMKVSDAEWQWDRRRLTFYFTAEERVDFRTLVRQLESHFGVRVQMWHIGPRDEAKRLDGIGHCGRQLCSASWLPELLPVKTSLAKEQRLSTITPTQISGACGRLMCCLRYEHEFYVAARKRFPKQGKLVQTLNGEEKVEHTDIFRDLVTLRSPSGELRTIPLAQFKRELSGEAMPVEEELHESEEDIAEEGGARVVTEPARGPVVQMQRAATAAPPRELPPREPLTREPPPREPSPRQGPHRDQRPPHREQRPGPAGAAAAPPPEPTASAPTAPAPQDAPRVERPIVPDADAGAQATGEGAERRGRRRRGRRGGRRHRHEQPPGTQGNSGNGGGPSGPPSTPTSHPNR